MVVATLIPQQTLFLQIFPLSSSCLFFRDLTYIYIRQLAVTPHLLMFLLFVFLFFSLSLFLHCHLPFPSISLLFPFPFSFLYILFWVASIAMSSSSLIFCSTVSNLSLILSSVFFSRHCNFHLCKFDLGLFYILHVSTF